MRDNARSPDEALDAPPAAGGLVIPAGADDPAPPDHTQDLEVENCTVHSTLDDFTDEVLRAALNCRHPKLQVNSRFRVEYVYESGEHRLAAWQCRLPPGGAQGWDP